ncbi:MAG: GNAT family N-acetyltransferase, partial [Planctomycetaceae bacterium]|nr:GNAT family N-acetyltransferase [Planctomycetaceae bacterium]
RDRGRTRTAIETCSMTSRESKWDTAAVIDVTGSWEAYLAARPESWRKKLDRYERLLQEAGTLEYVRYRPAGTALGDDALREDLYEECDLVASRGGAAGTIDGMVLGHPNTGRLLRAIHRHAVEAGAADLNLLRLNGRPIAFRYNVHLGGCVETLRSGCDPDGLFDGAGQVLMARWLEDSFHRGDRVIHLGPGNIDAKQPWLTRLVHSYRYTKFSTLSPRAQLLTWSSWLKANVRQAMVAAGDRYLGQPADPSQQETRDSAGEGSPGGNSSRGDSGSSQPVGLNPPGNPSAAADSGIYGKGQPLPADAGEVLSGRRSE